jgi:solute carrier family 45 protein 1/2/4
VYLRRSINSAVDADRPLYGARLDASIVCRHLRADLNPSTFGTARQVTCNQQLLAHLWQTVASPMTGFSPSVLAERGTAGYYGDARWAGASKILGPRWANLLVVTICFLGVQILWSVEMSYGISSPFRLTSAQQYPHQASPYLLSLGLSKSWMAIVFIAGPLSGLIMQPLIGQSYSLSPSGSCPTRMFSVLYIGALADNSKSRFGRRRPYMIGGTLLCMGAVLLLGFTRPFATIFIRPGTPSVSLFFPFFVCLFSSCLFRMTY